MSNIEKAFQCSIQKTKRNIDKIGSDLREYIAQEDGEYFKGNRDNYIKLSHIFGWTQSFFTGMGYWAYRMSKDSQYLKWLNGFRDEYYHKVFVTPLETMHDLGFLYTLYAVMLYKETGNQDMKAIGIKAADELAKRYNPMGGYIRAWGRMDDQTPSYVDKELAKNHFFTESKGLAIIDCMMNIPLLFWASEVTGNPFYSNIAIMHANMTQKYFIRVDNSVCHAYRFNETTGEPIGEANYCGYSVDSHWARGTAWAIYGFAIAYTYTKDKHYLQTAIKLADKYLANSDENGIPIWDFKLPSELKQTARVDTSAAAIVACGLQVINAYQQEKHFEVSVEKILTELSGNYTNYDSDVPGLLKEQNGLGHYACYGDYFFMEALVHQLTEEKRIW